MSNSNFISDYGSFDNGRPRAIGETVPFLSVKRTAQTCEQGGIVEVTFYDGRTEAFPLPEIDVPMPSFDFDREPRWRDGSEGVDLPIRMPAIVPLVDPVDTPLPRNDPPKQPRVSGYAPRAMQAGPPQNEHQDITEVVESPVNLKPNTLRSVLFGEDLQVPEKPKDSKPKGPRVRDHLRDTVLIDLLGFNEGDSPAQQLITGLSEIKDGAKRQVNSYSQAAQNVSKGTAEVAKEVKDEVAPRLRQAAVMVTAAAALSTALVTGGQSGEQAVSKAEPAAVLPIERVSVTVPITSTEDLNNLADSLQIGPEEMAVLAQQSGIQPGEIREPARLTLKLQSSTLTLSKPATAEQMANRFGLPKALVEAANPGSDEEAQTQFDIPGRTLFSVNTDSPNIAGAAQVMGVDPALAKSLNTVSDGVVAMPPTTNVNQAQQKAAAIALLAPAPKGVEAPAGGEQNPLLQPSAPASTPEKPVEQMTDKEYMQYLADQVNPTIYDLFALNVDTSRMGAFDSELSGKRIQPQKFVGHWTAGLYERGVDQFIGSIKGRTGNCCNVTYFMDKEGQVFQFADPTLKTSHAKGANSISQGVEIEARNLRDYTPQQMLNFVLLAYRFLREQNIPIERVAFTGHQEVDVIHAHRGQKSDMPTELVDLLFPKLKALDDAVRVDEAKNRAANDELQQYSSQERYDMLLDLLLAEISKGEGGVDSVNQGHAGDTPVDSAAYHAIFGDRKLSDLTIAEVMDLQARGIIFTAGAHQMIPVVLKGAVQWVKIDINRKFDASAQKELAVGYLVFGKRKHLKGYINGENVSLNAAVQDLCQEFASMPCPSGEGFYDGDSAGNNVRNGLKRLPQIRGILQMLRQAQQDRIADMKAAAASEQPDKPTDTTTTTTADNAPAGGKDETSTTAASEDGSSSSISTTSTIPSLITKVATKPNFSPTELPVDVAHALAAVYLGSDEAAAAWLDKQDIIQDANGTNTRVLVDVTSFNNTEGEE